MSDSSELHIRTATAQDADLLRDLGSRIFIETFAADNTAENMAAYLASAFSLSQVSSEIVGPASITYIAEIAGVPVAYARLRSGEAEVDAQKPIELVRLYVDSAHHGTGVAAALMQKCIDTAAANGHDAIWLGVWEHNPRAQAFYRKWGFERVGSQVFQLGDDPQRDWIMSRRLLS